MLSWHKRFSAQDVEGFAVALFLLQMFQRRGVKPSKAHDAPEFRNVILHSSLMSTAGSKVTDSFLHVLMQLILLS